jgi:hypothetical protein
MFNCFIKSTLLFSLVILLIACTHFYSIIEELDHRYYVFEPDAYMHLVIASDLLNHHEWYQHFNYRLNAPYGADTHAWTHVISAILVTGTFLISFLTTPTKALYIWGFVLPIIFNAVAVCAMLWCIKPLKPTSYQRLFIFIAFLINPFVNSYFAPLRVDYDFFLITLGIVYLGCFLRLLRTNENGWVFATGIIATLGIWTSISFVILVLISLVFIIGVSIEKNQTYLGLTKGFLAVLCLGLSVIIPLEHRHFFSVSFDIVSIVYLTFFSLLLISLTFYERYSSHSQPFKKILVLLVLMLLNALIMNYFFPGFYLGPYNHVDPYLIQHFFPVISEFYSPFKIDNALTLALLSYFIIGVVFFYYLYLESKANDTKAIFNSNKIESYLIGFLLCAATVMTAFTLYMYRWIEFATPLNILLISFFVAHCCKKTGNRLGKLCLVATMAILPATILLLKANDTSHPQELCQTQLHNMIHDDFLEKPPLNHDKMIFAESNYGPLILYATHYSIVATNDHHNPLGIKDSFNFFKANEIAAKNIVMSRGVDLILLCNAKRPTGFNIDSSQWLQNIPLPEAYSQWRLYRVAR